jgi:hypothetical protein
MMENLIDEDIFQKATDGFKHDNECCPRCGARGKLTPYGGYWKWLVSIDGKGANAKRIYALRFECRSCGATHALLPDILVPYSQYSLRFKLTVLIAYFERDEAVIAVCERFGIAVSTVYEWKKILLLHKALFLGVLLDQKEPALTFLNGLLSGDPLSDHLKGFFQRYAFSFLQDKPIPATHSRSP